MNAPVEASERRDAGTGTTSVVLSALTGETLVHRALPTAGAAPAVEVRLELAPDQAVVVGRSRRAAPYLDPAYRPSPVLPGTDQTVFLHGGRGDDGYVSRGHFLLRHAPGGVLLVNGVPRRGGGVRAPLNGTWLLAPVRRPLDPEEEFLIASGTSAVLVLPNGSELRVAAA